MMKFIGIDLINFSHIELSTNNISEICNLDRENFPFPWTEAQWGNLIEDKNYIVFGNLEFGFTLWSRVNLLPEAHLIKILIKKPLRNCGRGHDLLCFALSHLQDSGVSEFSLEVQKSNENALKLYKSLGFEVINHINRFYSNGDDAYVLQKCVAE